MPVKCAVKDCKSYKGETEGVHFFRFPKNCSENWLTVVDKPGKMFTLWIPLIELSYTLC